MESLRACEEILLALRNADGGWGYVSGKGSWLEPTAWSAIALCGRPEAEQALRLMLTWQRPGGAFRPCPGVEVDSWATSLAVIAACIHGRRDGGWQQAAGWLVSSHAVLHGWSDRLVRLLLRRPPPEVDLSLKAWSWYPETTAWVEPTALAMLALRLWSRGRPSAEVSERLRSAQLTLLNRRTADGGWNYGNRSSFGVKLESYPETVGAALLGWAGGDHGALGPAMRRAKEDWVKPLSPLARASLRLGLRLLGEPVDEQPQEAALLRRDPVTLAIEIAGRRADVVRLLQPEATA